MGIVYNLPSWCVIISIKNWSITLQWNKCIIQLIKILVLLYYDVWYYNYYVSYCALNLNFSLLHTEPFFN